MPCLLSLRFLVSEPARQPQIASHVNYPGARPPSVEYSGKRGSVTRQLDRVFIIPVALDHF